ncbi:hypothetical protein GCM10010222_79230 [Streptomyces tanashiensis]|uniref:hypothetical protein n=1 Tax=Streptomyces tanashiensis TaxID=67367 RepID=UPI00167BED2D|nr:hypothetical protein [Streptomyces tanashiensis]GGT25434.1 hypothetical protein GCM10010222_79230 [Streptomyces tanashiensis]
MKKLRAAVVTIAAVAGLAMAVPPTAQAASGCTSGGKAYICEFGVTTKKLPNGTKQVFLVAPDRAVWTRWTDSDGDWSHWLSMGGVAMSAVVITVPQASLPWQFAIHVIGGDGVGWFRERDANGNWSEWARNRDPQ